LALPRKKVLVLAVVLFSAFSPSIIASGTAPRVYSKKTPSINLIGR